MEKQSEQMTKSLADLEEQLASGGNLETKENSLIMRLQQIHKMKDQQKRCQDLEKEAESKKKVYLTASQNRAEIKEILNKMEQAYLDAQAGVLAADLQDGMPCPVCGSVHHPKLTQIPEEVPTEEQLKKRKMSAETAEKAASDAKCAGWISRRVGTALKGRTGRRSQKLCSAVSARREGRGNTSE